MITIILAVFTALLAALVSVQTFVCAHRSADLDLADPADREGVAPSRMQRLLSSVERREKIAAVCCALADGAAAFCVLSSGIHPLAAVRLLLVVLILTASAVFDTMTHRIPNLLVLILLGVGAVLLLLEYLFRRDYFLSVLLSGLAGFLVYTVFLYLAARIIRGGIGMGDVKIFAALGWTTGIGMASYTLLFSMILAAIAAVGMLLFQKKKMKDQIPFAPFILSGYLISLLLVT